MCPKDADRMANSVDNDQTTPTLFAQTCQSQYEPRHKKICLQGFRPGKMQTGLRSHSS